MRLVFAAASDDPYIAIVTSPLDMTSIAVTMDELIRMGAREGGRSKEQNNAI